MNRFVVFITILILAVSVSAQKKSDANIFGHVIHKETKEHMPFVNIALKGTSIGAATDATGHYFLKNLPEGRFVLVVSGLGYKPQERVVEIVANKSLEIDFVLEEDAIMLDNIVVSANRNETNRREAPAIINVISPKMFENTNSVCLAQGLNFQPGLRVETNCQNCGFQQVRINGLDGPYSQILIDSRPIFSSLVGVYGLEQIPANMIERVEVMRGGGSALFGSNAIAGTINIITREPVANSVTLGNTSSLIDGRETDVNTSVNASVVSDNNKGGVMIFGSSRQRSALDYDGDGFTELTKIEAKNIGFRGFYRTGHYSKITLEYHNLGEYRRGGNKLNLPAHQADIAEQVEHNVHTGGVKFDLFSKDYLHRFNVYTSLQGIDRKSYYGTRQNPNAYGTTDDFSLVSGMQYGYSMAKFIFMPSEWTLGLEYNRNELDDKVPGYNRYLNQRVHTKSAFVQNEWKSTQWSILVGGRFDKHNLIDHWIVSPRLNVRYSPSSFVSLRSSFSTGFRAPQAFDEDLHISLAGGEASIIVMDPDLDTERSQSFSASIDFNHVFGRVLTNFLVEGFHTNLKDVFVLNEMGEDALGNKVFERRNGKGAIVQGINLEGMVVPARWFQFQFGATFQKSRYKEPEQWSNDAVAQKKMFRTPSTYGYLTTTYSPVKPMNVSLSGTYTGSMLVQHFAGYIVRDVEVQTPEFYDVNLKLSYDIAINGQAKLQVNGGVQNMFNSYQDDFDMGVSRDSGYVYGPAQPRTAFVGLKFTL